MRKLLMASAALALSTSFAFASSYGNHYTPSFSVKVVTGDNYSKIANIAVASKGGEVYQTNINTVQQNTGVFIQPIGPLGTPVW